MKRNKPKILFIDDDIAFLQEVIEGLEEVFDVMPCNALDKAKQRLVDNENKTNQTFSLILLDLVFGQNENEKAGVDFLEFLTVKYPHLPVIIVTQHDSVRIYRRVQEAGAKEFFVKSEIDFDSWTEKIKEEIAKSQQVEKENIVVANPTSNINKKVENSIPLELGESVEDYPFLGKHSQMVTIRSELIALSEEPDVSVLLLGETGVGKEMAARYLHSNGIRSKEAFKAVNLVAIGNEVLESTLFGHKKGAFTGAIADYEGAFEEANGGVLFLDEIGEISSLLQQKLLRFLEDKVITPLGGKEKKVDVQIVAATNRNLKEEVAKGAFRLDLYHRLNDYAIVIPPLRERRDDIQLIADYYLEKRGFDHDVFTREIWGHFYSYYWPGNVRELVSTIKRLLLKKRIAKIEIVDASYLPQEIINGHEFTSIELQVNDAAASNDNIPLDQRTAKNELQQIENALIKYKWKSKVAEVLGFKNLDQLRYRIEEKYAKEYPDLFEHFPTICKKYKVVS